MKIVVLGYIVRGPLGGLVWHHFQYVYGLHRMGHDVLFLEDSEEYAACYNPETFQMTTDPMYGLNFVKEIFSKFNLQNHWAYFNYHSNRWFGQSESQVLSFSKDADIVLNLSGINPLREWILTIPKKIFVDTDPVFTQIKHLSNIEAKKMASLHDTFFTFGENFGKQGCTIPDDGFNWLPTRQPVVMEFWNHVGTQNNGKWTTVMQWDSYKTQRWKGKTYGMKSKSFDEFIELPQKCSEKFELALGSNSSPIEMLASFGWEINNPLEITKTPYTYQNYLKNSKGEWSVAKHGYVTTNSGWFSERTLNYMASGKPVVVQETGFSEFLPVGEGLLSFSSKEEAVEGMKKVNTDYHKHCKTARQIVKEYFDSSSVLQLLLDRIN